jgi:lipopolysaccharide biosynthesis glycosyltransferase
MKTAIANLCIGEREAPTASISHPLMQAYAKKIGADFHVFSERLWPDVDIRFEKFQMYEVVKNYSRTLFVDTDVMIRNDSPNIFDIVPEGQFGIANEAAFFARARLGNNFHIRIPRLLKLVGSIPAGWKWNGAYYNSGVMVLDPSFAWIFKDKPEGNLRKADWADQGIVNLRIVEKGLVVKELPFTFNYMLWGAQIMDKSVTHKTACANNYFVHDMCPVRAWRKNSMKETADEWDRMGKLR